MNRFDRLKSLRSSEKKVVEVVRGEKGEPGQPGEKGDRGERGELGLPGQPGKDGAPGLKGDKGDPGLPGEKGIDGSVGLVWRGEWKPDTKYSAGDAVNSNGSAFICQTAHTSNYATLPGVGTRWPDQWDTLAQQGEKGAGGTQGVQGPPGPAGQGLAAGGTTDQVLAKNSDADYDTKWVTETGGGGTWGSITGSIPDQADLQAALDAKLNLSGGTMAGLLDMAGNYIQDVAALIGPAGLDILVQGSNVDGPPSVGGTAGSINIIGGQGALGTGAAGGNVLIGGGQSDPDVGVIGNIYLFNSFSGVTTQLDISGVTSNRIVTFPDESGTIAYLSDLDLKAPLASPALTGNPTAPTQSPFDNSTKIATTAYVDSAFASFDTKPAVAYASTSALPANTYNNGSSGVGATLTGNSNGPLIIDGVTLTVGQAGEYVLVAGEATPANNGWYVITQVGVVAVSPYILTRVTDSDQSAEIGSGYLTSVIAPNGVTAGSANNGEVFISIAAADPFVVGTTNLTFSQVGGIYTNGNGLGLSGNTFSIDTSVTVDKTTAQTLTNKRNTPRVTTITSSATPTINTDNCDVVTVTALAADITSMTTNLSGTPNAFDKLLIRFKDNGTARAITWGTSFEACGVALPTTTVISKRLTVGLLYSTVSSKWGCVAVAQEA